MFWENPLRFLRWICKANFTKELAEVISLRCGSLDAEWI
jgi:hypothetical protein